MKECIKDFCDKETKEKCDSFYKEAFLNRNELVRMLKEENKQLKSQLNQSEEVIDEAISYCNEYKDYLDYKYMTNLYNTHLLDILQKIQRS